MTFRIASGWLVVSRSTGPVRVASMVNLEIAMGAELVSGRTWLVSYENGELADNVSDWREVACHIAC